MLVSEISQQISYRKTESARSKCLGARKVQTWAHAPELRERQTPTHTDTSWFLPSCHTSFRGPPRQQRGGAAGSGQYLYLPRYDAVRIPDDPTGWSQGSCYWNFIIYHPITRVWLAKPGRSCTYRIRVLVSPLTCGFLSRRRDRIHPFARFGCVFFMLSLELSDVGMICFQNRQYYGIYYQQKTSCSKHVLGRRLGGSVQVDNGVGFVYPRK